MIHHVTKVEPRQDQTLRLHFDTDEVRIFDARPFLDRGRFVQLNDWGLFQQARVVFGTVEWPGDLDLDPEDLYRYSAPE